MAALLVAAAFLIALLLLLRYQRRSAEAAARADETRRASLVRRLSVGQFHFTDDGQETQLRVDLARMVATRRVESRAGMVTSDLELRRLGLARWEMRPSVGELARVLRRLNDEHGLTSDDEERSLELPQASRSAYRDRYEELCQRRWKLLPDEVALSLDAALHDLNAARGTGR